MRDICLVCMLREGSCICMTCMSVSKLDGLGTAYLERLLDEMTDPQNRWPDGREDNAARAIKSILERRKKCS